MDAQSVDFLTATAFRVGTSLLSLCDRNTSDDADLDKFATEVKAYASAWSILLPSLHDPTIDATSALVRTLELIIDDTKSILKDLGDAISVLSKRHGRVEEVAAQSWCFPFGIHQQSGRHQLLRTFLTRQAIVLHRSQIIYATRTLNLISVVFNAARSNLSRNPATLSTDNELFLLNEQQRARAKVEQLEGLLPNLKVRARLWLEPLPDRQHGQRTIFAWLIQKWVAIAPGANSRHPNNGQLHIIIEQIQSDVLSLRKQVQDQNTEIQLLRNFIAQQQEIMQNYEATIQSLRQELSKLRQDCVPREEYDNLHEQYQLLRQHCEKLWYNNSNLKYEIHKLGGRPAEPPNMPHGRRPSQPSSGSSRSSSAERDGGRLNLTTAKQMQARIETERTSLQHGVQSFQKDLRSTSQRYYPPPTYSTQHHKPRHSSSPRDPSPSSSTSSRTYVASSSRSSSRERSIQSGNMKLGSFIPSQGPVQPQSVERQSRGRW